MAEVRRQSSASLATALPCNAHQITGLKAGEALNVGEFVYIKTSDGLVWKATGAADNAAAKAVGVVAQNASVGEAVTIHRGVRYRWTVSGTPGPGTLLYLSGTNAGELADAASTGGLLPIAYVCDDQGRIQLTGLCG